MDDLCELVARRVHARPVSEEEARAVLERLAAQEGKSFEQLVGELRDGARRSAQRAADPVHDPGASTM